MSGIKRPIQSSLTRDEYKKQFSVRLKTLMDGAGLTTKALAREANISEDTIKSYLKGKTAPNLRYLGKIADVFYMDPSQLRKID